MYVLRGLLESLDPNEKCVTKTENSSPGLQQFGLATL